MTAPPVPSPATTSSTVAISSEVAALPEGNGARVAVVVDDVGINDADLDGYLRLPVRVTFAVVPNSTGASRDATAIKAAGREAILHIPLSNRRGARGWPSGLWVGMSRPAIDEYLDRALAQVPGAVGANNHEGAYGSTQPALMGPLLQALHERGLFFLDSVTAGGTVGFKTAKAVGLPPRINNAFLDHLESDDDTRQALFSLVEQAARTGSAIGQGHVQHPYLVRALQTYGPQLEARGYRFVSLSEVTNQPMTTGLDQYIRS